jgi:hypothetical protein
MMLRVWATVLVISLAACGDSNPTEPGTPDDVDAGTVDQFVVAPDTAIVEPDAAIVEPDAAPAGNCDPANLQKNALEKGKKILTGVTLTESTPIADILADPGVFDGKTRRIEGIIVEICQSQGCYLTLQDHKGNALNLKVIDGTLDFRLQTEVGFYAVGEGPFNQIGEHGAQLDIMNGGAMIGDIACGL